MRKFLALTTCIVLLQTPLAFAQDMTGTNTQYQPPAQAQQLSENEVRPPIVPYQQSQASYPPVYYVQPSPASPTGPQDGDYGFSVVNDLRQLNF